MPLTEAQKRRRDEWLDDYIGGFNVPSRQKQLLRDVAAESYNAAMKDVEPLVEALEDLLADSMHWNNGMPEKTRQPDPQTWHDAHIELAKWRGDTGEGKNG